MFELNYAQSKNTLKFISENYETLQELRHQCVNLIIAKSLTFNDLIVFHDGSDEPIDLRTFLGNQCFSSCIIVGRNSNILLSTDNAKCLLDLIDDTIKRNHPLASKYDYEGLIRSIDYTACEHTHKLTFEELKNIAKNT